MDSRLKKLYSYYLVMKDSRNLKFKKPLLGTKGYYMTISKSQFPVSEWIL